MSELSGARSQALGAVDHLRDLLIADVEFERLLDGYLDSRTQLAASFQRLARAGLSQNLLALHDLRGQIESRMRELYEGSIPTQLLRVRGYTGIHRVLYGYLIRHRGEAVSASKLRILTGEQIHTERRVRELRDLGCHIEARHSAGESAYVLLDAEPDLTSAARLLIDRNIVADSSALGGDFTRLMAIIRSRGATTDDDVS